MHLLAFGINHHTAPVDIREKAAFATDKLVNALHEVTGSGGVAEATIVSTCNRTELYCGLEPAHDEQVIEWFCHYHRLNRGDIHPYLYRHPDQEAVKHVFRVAAGLDSMILGEPQILGQMKEAFATAHKAGVTGKILNRLFQQTFTVAKQVRTDTAIGASAVSVASAAVRLAEQIFNKLSEQTVLLIGAGDMIELCARHLREHDAGHMIFANRTVERAQLLAGQFDAEGISLAEMPTRLADADIVIASTASQLPILGKGAVERALKARKHRPMFMLDIAVPRDIEAEVGELNDVYLYTIDDLKEVVQENMESRQEAAREAEKIIDTQVVDFMRWVKSLDAVPTIRAIRESADALREAEVERARRRLAHGEDPAKVIEQLARALTNKFTHAPTDVLRKADHDGNGALLEAARRLFGLHEE
ncbi:glutamyl-tRNA reductase [Sulfuricaulis sp.]|jgi:glutamyl-tRNA reductase|uniref:glutamyl-tRNA reductase n=1 Tax=Sulfuricaulis sp. TaxID=2003553 RepID=UPI00355A2B75